VSSLEETESKALLNILEQERLVSQLSTAVVWTGTEKVAERLGLTVPELEEHLAKNDFTMTELRLLATSCGIHISYNLHLGDYISEELHLSSLKKNEKTDD